jgi:hypothetical protein
VAGVAVLVRRCAAGSEARLRRPVAAVRGAGRTTCVRGVGDAEATSTWLSLTLPPGDVGQLSKPNVPGITVSGTTSAATSTTARGTLAMNALAILIRRPYRHL